MEPDEMDKFAEQTARLPNEAGAANLANRADHPSQQQFIELLADQIIAGMTKEKPCPYEPDAKPCDHCSMCNSRGF